MLFIITSLSFTVGHVLHRPTVPHVPANVVNRDNESLLHLFIYSVLFNHKYSFKALYRI